MWQNLLYLTLVLLLLAIYYFYTTFTYWQRKKLLCYPATSPIFGSMRNNLTAQISNIYEFIKSQGAKHGGFYFFHAPCYMPIEPELIKHIVTKDFEYFNAKGFYHNEKDQPINSHLFHVGGERWKKLRIKLTPTFTSGKLKQMFTTINDCSKPLVKCVEKHAANNLDVDIKDIASKYTTDVIGSCAFGIECNSFGKMSSEFHQYGKQLFQTSLKRQLLQMMAVNFPNLSRRLGIVLTPKHIAEFYTKTTLDTLKYREEHKIQRNDFMQLLMDRRDNGRPDERISTQEIINQSFIFYLAGYETSSSVMTFALLELSHNQAMQEKLREEIIATLEKHNCGDGEPTYEAIQEMKYLSKVVDETLRKYPPLAILNRQCTKEYQVPGSNLTLEVGTKVFIPVLPLQYDEEFYPEPEKFDPERFSEENKASRPSHAFLPFGEGPRQCIGLRFGYMQTKIGLIALLRRFRFGLDAKIEFPIKFSHDSFVLIPKETILLKTTKIE